MLDGLQLAEPERVVFERPPLVLAVFQVQFSNLPEVTDGAYIEPFRLAIEDQYPSVTPSKQLAVQLDLLSGQPRRSETTQWQFADKEADWTVVLAPNFLTLEARRYEHFEEFVSRLHSLMSHLAEHIRPKVGTRLGLRYINEMRVGTEKLSSIVRPELLGLLAVDEFERHAAQASQEMLLSFSEDQAIQIRHGFFPDGSVVQPRPGEAPATGPFYLLDFDMFREFSAPVWLNMEPDFVAAYVVSYHDEIEKVFRWSLTEAFTQSLGVRNDAD
jgi:uncharacterized protein (TIGR04255 family)